MAKSTDTSTTFRTLALATAALLIGAAALIYLNDGESGGAAGELAALTQALPGQSRSALAGEPGAYERLVASERRFSQLLAAAGGAAGGRGDDWRALSDGIERLVSGRQVFEAAATSAAELHMAAGEARVIADQLLDRSGATRIVQVRELGIGHEIDVSRRVPKRPASWTRRPPGATVEP